MNYGSAACIITWKILQISKWIRIRNPQWVCKALRILEHRMKRVHNFIILFCLFASAGCDQPNNRSHAGSIPCLPTSRPYAVAAAFHLVEEPGADGATMVLVPGGTFTMGSEAFLDSRPLHRVSLDSFWMDA